jgi:hypothetical protein
VTEAGRNVGAGAVALRIAGTCGDKTSLVFRWTRMIEQNLLPIVCRGTGTVAIGWGFGGTYGWYIQGVSVCERAGDVWDVTFGGQSRSDDLGPCGDPAEGQEGWVDGFSVQSQWTNRGTGGVGSLNMYWNNVKGPPIPYVIPHADGVITTDADDGCWAFGSVYDATFTFFVAPALAGV